MVTTVRKIQGAGGSGGLDDRPYWLSAADVDNAEGMAIDIAVDSVGNVITLSRRYIQSASEIQMLLIKYDTDGNLLWERLFSQDVGGFLRPVALALDSNDDVIMIGTVPRYTNNLERILIVKYNSSGVYQWLNTLFDTNLLHATDVVIDSSDNIIISGFSKPSGRTKTVMLLVKCDSSGNKLWDRYVYGNVDHDRGQCVAVDSNDNIFMAGDIAHATKNYLVGLVKYNTSGTLQWQRTVEGAYLIYGRGNISVDPSDDLILSCSPADSNYTLSIAIIKFNSSGTYQWDIVLPEPGGGDYAYPMSTVDTEGNVICVTYGGGTGFFDPPPSVPNKMVVIKVDSSGSYEWSNTIVASIGVDELHNVTTNAANSIFVSGTTGAFGSADSFMAKLPPDGTGQGTYGTLTFAALTITPTTLSPTINTTGLLNGTGTLGEGTPGRTLSDGAATVTNTQYVVT